VRIDGDDPVKVGLVHIYTGEGKGKTTAAIGLSLRNLAYGNRVLVVQFLKAREKASGEILALSAAFPNVEIRRFGSWITPKTSKEELERSHKPRIRKGINFVRSAVSSGEFDLIILDELCVTVKVGLVTEKDVLDLINSKADKTELVITGRGATEKMINAADLVTEMVEIKHPFKSGVAARKGIEY